MLRSVSVALVGALLASGIVAQEKPSIEGVSRRRAPTLSGTTLTLTATLHKSELIVERQ